MAKYDISYGGLLKPEDNASELDIDVEFLLNKGVKPEDIVIKVKSR